MSDQRTIPTDVFVLQPGKGPRDPNTTATGKTWGDGQRWLVIQSIAELVGEVKRKCGANGYLRVLRIGGHGSTESFRLGNLKVTVTNIEDLSGWLKDLHPYVIQGKTLVYLDHCFVGHAEILMKRLAVLMGGVTVIGPFSGQVTNSGAPVFEGGKATICTGRTCISTVFPNDDPRVLIEFVRDWEIISGAYVLDPQGPVNRASQ